MRRENYHKQLSVWIQRYFHVGLVIAGLLLIILLVVRAKPTNLDEFSKFTDTILKLLAVIVVGFLLPRIASLKLWGAELTLREETEKVTEAINLLTNRVASLEATCNGLGGGKKIAEGATAKELPASPPELGDPVPRLGDRQKGRFGGLAEKDGYRLQATFPKRASAGDLVFVWIEVRKAAGNFTAPVRFYLHETFPSEQVDVMPKDGIARLELLVWGGFTVGAWPTETADTLLELDLAQVSNAPPAIRGR